jgi:hypothetical protein
MVVFIRPKTRPLVRIWQLAEFISAEHQINLPAALLRQWIKKWFGRSVEVMDQDKFEMVYEKFLEMRPFATPLLFGDGQVHCRVFHREWLKKQWEAEQTVSRRPRLKTYMAVHKRPRLSDKHSRPQV